jgi:hypothetical protein
VPHAFFLGFEDFLTGLLVEQQRIGRDNCEALFQTPRDLREVDYLMLAGLQE